MHAQHNTHLCVCCKIECMTHVCEPTKSICIKRSIHFSSPRFLLAVENVNNAPNDMYDLEKCEYMLVFDKETEREQSRCRRVLIKFSKLNEYNNFYNYFL